VDGTIVLLERRYRPGDLHGAFLAVAATDDRATNLQVAKEARGETVLVNVVDDAEHSDYIVPSVINRGDITIAVSTAGRSPALARKIRGRLEKEIGPEYAELAVLVGEVRGEARHSGISATADDWQECLDLDALLDLLRCGKRQEARTMLLDGLKRNGIREAHRVAPTTPHI
jgi:siroheme synthase-like protein